MATGAFPVAKLHEDSLLFPIRDITPRAPTHVLLISREHIPTARELTVEHGPLLAHMVGVANRLGGDPERGGRGERPPPPPRGHGRRRDPAGGHPGPRRARLPPRLHRGRRGRPDDLSPAPAPARRRR